MRIALVLSHYFEHGGMQRDFLGIARELTQRGHQCFVYCQSWRGELPAEITVRQLPVPSPFSVMSNHRRLQKFDQLLQSALAKEKFDGVVGFEKMPGLDICFVPDACFVERAAHEHMALYRYTTRHRHFASWEKAVFDPSGDAHILCVSPDQQAVYEACYRTPSDRLHTLPGGLLPDRVQEPGQRMKQRAAMRNSLGLIEGALTLLFVGSSFRTKGLDRAIRALASLSELQPGSRCRMLVVGAGRTGKYQKLARRLGVAEQIEFMGARTDIIALMNAADIMLHPARTEAGGAVLLEALVAGLPVIASGVCGHARHIAAAGAGVVLPEPFEQTAFNAALVQGVEQVFRDECSRVALAYVETTDLFSMHVIAAQKIETLLHARRAGESTHA